MTDIQQSSGFDELIARLEAATEGGEALDREIADAVLEPAGSVRLIGGSVDIPQWRYPDGSVGTELRFSRSLDAALTLMPESWTAYEIHSRRRMTTYWVEITKLRDEDDLTEEDACRGYGETAALAFCAAALKARQAHD